MAGNLAALEGAERREPRDHLRGVEVDQAHPTFHHPQGEPRFFGETRIGGTPHDAALRFELRSKHGV